MARVGTIGGMNAAPARVGVPPVSGIVSSGDYRLFGVPKTIAEATTLTRASTGTYIDVNGVMQTAAIDALRFDYSTGAKMMLAEAEATNSIRNNTMVGAIAGTPGTLPTNWTVGTLPSGISREIVAMGVEGGVTFIDIRFYGTAGASGSWSVNLETTSSIAAVQAEVWTCSAYVKLASGAVPGTTNIGISEYSSVPAFLTFGQSSLSVTAALARYSHTRTISSATAAYARPAISGSITNGQVFDFTIRIGLPQMEKAASASSAIPTTSAAVTRSADVLTLIGTGTNNWLLTFDNDAVQAFAGEVDDLAITASALTRPRIKSWVARTA